MSQDVGEAMNDANKAARVGIAGLFVRSGATVEGLQFYNTLSCGLRSKHVLQLTQIFIAAPSFKENCPEAIGMVIVFLNGLPYHPSMKKRLVVMLLLAPNTIARRCYFQCP
ncbi:hypothetical protein GX50_07981 [[Emmonsia] crescens]|uniref:Uncharacterized protein n=1 Tax=[Emmonsia] crescens TaxID=73230 RepID=A0A2B7Z5S9_9EURO|nr:hypothetical protein GX50_07981 [Emmonsia crescens]